MSGGGFNVSIPSSAKKMIENIKEIAENHSDEEIYAMLKECSMDPDETIQKLLLQDPFHEVKSKRDRRKENANSKESVDSRWKATNHGRGGRGGSSNIAPRYPSNDAVGGRNSISGKENGVNHVVEKKLFHDTKNKERSMAKSTLPVIDNGPTSLPSENPTKIKSFFVGIDNKGTALPPSAAIKKPTNSSSKRDSPEQSSVDSGSQSASTAPVASSVAYFSSSNSMLVSLKDSEFLDAVSSTKCNMGTEQFLSELSSVNPTGNTSTAETIENVKTLTEGNIPSKSQGLGGNQINEFSQSSTSGYDESAISLPSSNYNNRPQQIIGSQKVGFNKEWKPKTKNSFGVEGPGTLNKTTSLEPGAGTFEAIAYSQPAAEVHDSKEITKLEEKAENMHLPPTHLVILPNHIHVPESERTKLSFGSFGVGFELNTCYGSSPGSDKTPTPVSESETFVDIEETSDGRILSDQNALETAKEGDYHNYSQSPTHVTESLSGEGNIPSTVIQEYNDLKQDMGLTAGSPQYSVVHPLQEYGFGVAPPLGGSQLSPFENSDSQARDVSRLPSFVVQQSFDPTSYYAQYYRSGADSDGRISPVPHTGVATKYNGNVAMLTPSPQEGGVPSPTTLGSQATGLMQSSVAVTQPPVAVFRPPTGMHISHFPPNYIPYGHYFSPFYVPPHIHQLLGNNAFPHQPQAGSIYPTPLPAAAAGVKYSLPQYKLGTNSGNSTQLGIPTGYGPYGSTPSGYNPNSAATGGNVAGNEDIGVASFKENNMYMTGPQSEGSAVWVAAPGREMSSLPGNSFYSLPPQGQPVTFTPTQAGHGTFASIYHPAQAAATVHPLLQQSSLAGGADMVGPGGNVYQQPQHSQTNWPSNY